MHLNQSTLDFIEKIYCKEANLLFQYAKITLGNVSIAEEAVQETFIVVCIKHKKMIASPNPEGWVMNTHKYVCKNIQRTRNYYLKKILLLDEMEHLTSYTEATFDEISDLENYVSPNDFMILKKIILDGYSYKDLAQELDITIGACRKRFHRAKQRFQRNFQS